MDDRSCCLLIVSFVKICWSCWTTRSSSKGSTTRGTRRSIWWSIKNERWKGSWIWRLIETYSSFHIFKTLTSSTSTAAWSFIIGRDRSGRSPAVRGLTSSIFLVDRTSKDIRSTVNPPWWNDCTLDRCFSLSIDGFFVGRVFCSHSKMNLRALLYSSHVLLPAKLRCTWRTGSNHTLWMWGFNETLFRTLFFCWWFW